MDRVCKLVGQNGWARVSRWGRKVLVEAKIPQRLLHAVSGALPLGVLKNRGNPLVRKPFEGL